MLLPTKEPLILMTRRFLQVAVAIGSLVPILAGLAGILLGPAMIDGNSSGTLSLDSHYRYLSGLLMGIGFSYVTTIPDIENKTDRFQLLTFIVFIGGLSRLYALVFMGVPGPSMIFGLTMELIITPLLALWQYSFAHAMSHQHKEAN